MNSLLEEKTPVYTSGSSTIDVSYGYGDGSFVRALDQLTDGLRAISTYSIDGPSGIHLVEANNSLTGVVSRDVKEIWCDTEFYKGDMEEYIHRTLSTDSEEWEVSDPYVFAAYALQYKDKIASTPFCVTYLGDPKLKVFGRFMVQHEEGKYQVVQKTIRDPKYYMFPANFHFLASRVL